MKRPVKKIIKVLSVLTVLFILLAVTVFLILQYFFPSEMIRERIESYLLDNYGISAGIGKIEFSILEGIRIDQLSIKDENIPDSLFSFESFVLKYDLSRLLKREIAVNNIEINRPVIRIVKDEDGNFNFDRILQKITGDKKETPELEDEDSSAPFKIDLKKLTVNSIDFQYEDRSSENPLNIELPDLTIEVSGVDFRDNENYQGEIKLRTDGKKRIIYRDKDNSLKFFQEMELDIKAENNTFDILLDHKITGLEMYSDLVNIDDIGKISTELKASYDMNSGNADISDLSLSIGELISTSLSGKVSGIGSELSADILIGEFKADIDNIVSFVQEKGLADLSGAGIKEGSLDIRGMQLRYNGIENRISASGSAGIRSSLITYSQPGISLKIVEPSLSADFDIELTDSLLNRAEIGLDINTLRTEAEVSGKIYSTGKLEISVTPVINDKMMPESAEVSINISDLAGGTLKSELSASFDLSDLSAPALIQNTSAELIMTAEDIEPAVLTDEAPEGLKLSFNEKMSIDQGVVNNLFTLSTEYLGGSGLKPGVSRINRAYSDSLFLPLDGLTVATELMADITGHDSGNYILNTFKIDAADLITADIKDLTAALSANQFYAEKFNISADLDNILKAAQAAGIEVLEGAEIYNGSVVIRGSGSADAENMNSESEFEISMGADLLKYGETVVEKGIQISEKIFVSGKDIYLNGTTEIKGADHSGLLNENGIEGDINISHNIKYESTGKINIREIKAELPSLKTNAGIEGYVNISDSLYSYDMTVSHSAELLKSYKPVPQLSNIRGNISGKTGLKGNINSVNVEHVLYLDSIYFETQLDTAGNKASVSNLTGNLPLNIKYDIENGELAETQGTGITGAYDYLDYTAKRQYYKGSGLPVSNLRIDSVDIEHELFSEKIKNIDFDVYFNNNKFCLNRFYFEIFDGNTAGFIRLDAGKGGFDEITERTDLDMYVNMTGINTYDLNIIFELNSKGLDIINEPDLNGGMSISKISSDDAEYLLEFLNKNSGDRTAGMVRNMLNAFPGIKVELFSFRIKNNFLYTKILLNKPWYLLYFPLPEQISLSKQSIKFYLDKYVKEE